MNGAVEQPKVRPLPVRIGAFISIPKNASKSVLKMLQIGPNRDLENTDSPVIYENHQRGSVMARRHDLTELFTFCFCRNPYDRCVSWFAYHQQLGLYKSVSFEQWIHRGMPHHFTIQNGTDYVRENLTPLSQHIYVENTAIDFIGRIENFDRDMQLVVDQLNGRAENARLNHRFTYSSVRCNASSRLQDFNRYYSPKTRAIVAELLRRDFLEFDYPV